MFTVTEFTVTVTLAFFDASALDVAVTVHGPPAAGAVHTLPAKLPQLALQVNAVFTEPVTAAAKVKVLSWFTLPGGCALITTETSRTVTIAVAFAVESS